MAFLQKFCVHLFDRGVEEYRKCQLYSDQKELNMCINPQRRQEIFNEIVEALENSRRLGSFSENLEAFEDIFRRVNQANHLQYDQDTGQRAQCIFFFPFSAQSAHWEGSIEILKSTSHYTVFDRHGRFSIYRRAGGRFGPIVITNSPDDAITKLEDISAVDFLSDMEDLKSSMLRLEREKRESLETIESLHERMEVMRKRMDMTTLQRMVATARKTKFWSKK